MKHEHTRHRTRTYEEALSRAADLWGIERGYTDTWGKAHSTAPEIQKAILGAMGVSSGTKEDLERAIEDREWQEWARLLPPVLVLGEAAPREFPVHVPEALARSSMVVEVRPEGREPERSEVALGDLRTSAMIELRGLRFVRKLVPLTTKLPLGYHDVRVSIKGREERRAGMRLILCPDRAYVPPAIRDGRKAAGVAIALYGLRSSRNWGCGDFTDLEALVDWLSDEIGAAFVGLNPLHDIPNRHPFNISPYLPTSAFFKNPIYLDVERIEEFRACRRARRLFARPDVQRELAELRESEQVDYGRVFGWKLRALKLAFAHFLLGRRRGAVRATEFDEYMEREGNLLDRYAVFSALSEWIHARSPEIWIWPDWPAGFHDPESETVRAWAKQHWRVVLFYKWVQWQVARQLAAAQERARRKGLPLGLFHDLALATDRYGADFWGCRSFYISGCRVGAPPDSFAPKGQDWSFPPPDSAHHRDTGYRLFADSIRKNCRSGGALRIDHVMRFFRLYWIPEGMDPAHGAYVRDEYEDLLHILALESVREKVAVVGEDLGTVTPQIRAALDRFGIYGYKVPYFEKRSHDEFRPPHEYPVDALVSSSTHDLPTLAGFWLGCDIEARRRAGQLDDASYGTQLAERNREKQKFLDLLHRLGFVPDWVPRRADHIPELTGELHNGFVGFLASTPCRLFALNQEDLLKETDQQNLPATTWQYPNWQHKMKFSVEELRTAQQARDFSAMFRHWLERTGRAARAGVLSADPPAA